MEKIEGTSGVPLTIEKNPFNYWKIASIILFLVAIGLMAYQIYQIYYNIYDFNGMKINKNQLKSIMAMPEVMANGGVYLCSLESTPLKCFVITYNQGSGGK